MGVWNVIFASQMNVKSRIDSDYFLPEYVVNERKLDEIETKKLTEIFFVSDGNHLEISRHFYDDNKMVPYYRGKDINDFFIENANPVRIPNHIYNLGIMKRSHFKAGDVLLSIVGTIGSLSVVPNTLGDATGSCKIAILRKKGTYSPFLLAAFLLSKYGQSQIKRNTRGAVQMGLILKDFVNIRVPVFKAEIMTEIEGMVTEAIEINNLSKTLYAQAQEILEKELGLDELKIIKNKTYESSFSEVIEAGRSDADYYQTHFRAIADHIKTIQTQPLSQIAYLLKGIEVGSLSYTDEGKLFIRVSNVKKSAIITGNSDKYISEGLFSTLKIYQPNVGDILLTKDGTLGECYVVDQEMEGIISGGIMKLILKNSSIPAEYLSLVINSKICKLQIERVCSGAIILHWKPRDIASLRIPILDNGIMTKLADLVTSSKLAKRESEMLLENAKKRIENLIEGMI